jgi:hypothetical protein
MSLLNDYQRVSRHYPCLVCGRQDWCLVSRDDPSAPSKVICARTESRFKWGEAGWLHRLRDDDSGNTPSIHRFTIRDRGPESSSMANLLVRARGSIDPVRLAVFADSLGISVSSLERLEVGWLSQGALRSVSMDLGGGAWAFPMRDVEGRLIGLRLRMAGGRKLAVRGGGNGIFIPRDFPPSPDRLLVAEGESDTAALLDLGFAVVGRPGCTTCTQLLARFVRVGAPREVVIVADNDARGRRGAEVLAKRIRLHCAHVRVVAPPFPLKDARAWKQAGATRGAFEAAIAAAPAITISAPAARGEV